MKLFTNKKNTDTKTKIKKAKKYHSYKFTSFSKNMKIAPKVLIGFFIIAIVGAGMGLYDNTVLNQVNTSSNQMYKEMLLPLRSINDISNEFQKECVFIRNMLVTEDTSNFAIYISEINKAKNNTNSSVDMLNTLISSDSDAKTNLNDFKNDFEAYDKLMSAAIQNIQSGRKDLVASDLLKIGDLYAAEGKVASDIDKLSFVVSSKASSLNTSNKQNAGTVQMNTFILIGVVVFLSLFIGIITARSISRPVKKLTNALKTLADGETDITPENTDLKNEIGQMMNAYESILTSIKNLEADTDILINAAKEGQLTVRADAEKHRGAYRNIVEGFNQTLDAVTLPVNEAADVLGEVSNGNLDSHVTGDFNGDYAIIKNSLNRTIDTLKELVSDTDMLIESAAEGRLTVRADSDKHQGAFRKIVEGFNTTLDAVILPIKEAVQVLSEVSKGNLEVTLTGDFKGDHAIIKDALNETIGTLKRYIGEISSVLGEIANGNLSHGITSEYHGNFIELKDSINKIVDSLGSMLSEINAASEQMALGTRQLSDGSQAISVGATEQAGSIEELTASIAGIAEQTKQNADNSIESRRTALAVKQAAEQCSSQMSEMLKSMDEINESSRNISKIIKVIDDIAFQTNILALNAAVEAARAGVHGKGFAVVAEEVRNLAARSAEAAKETAELIEGSIKKVTAGGNIANGTAEALSNIVKDVDKSVDLGEKIAEASGEQASAIAQINQGLEQVSRVVQNNSATAQEGAAASEELSAQAELLKKKIEVFKLKSTGDCSHINEMPDIRVTKSEEEEDDNDLKY